MLQVSVKPILRCRFLTNIIAIICFNPPISVFSCYTPELLCRSSSSRCTLIVYRDGGEDIENGKLRNTSLHVFYTSLVSICTPQRYFVHNYTIVCSYRRLLAIQLYATNTHYHYYSIYTVRTMDINLCGIVYFVFLWSINN